MTLRNLKINRYLIGLPILLLAIAMGGCSVAGEHGGRPEHDSAIIADSIADDLQELNDLTSIAYAYADSVLASMPIERKAAMMLMPAVFSRADRLNMRHILNYTDSMGVGGLVLLKGSLTEAAQIADTIASRGGAQIFLAVDAENGLRMRFPDAPEFPWNRELGRLSDDQVMYEFGQEIARECRLIGINMVLGPVMDVVPGNGSNGLMRKRSLGSDPEKVAELAIAYSRGIEDGNVISVAKHFPGHGSATQDTHKSLGEIESPRSVIDSIDLYPFRRYVEEGLSGVMIGHLSVRALDSIRRPAVVSPVIMNEILRRKLGFNGLIITDALNMEGALGVSAWQAIAAGADIVIAPSDTRREIEETVKAARRGDLSEEIITDRCRRILFYKYLLQSPRTHLPYSTLLKRVNELAPDVNASIRQSYSSD